MYLFEDRGLFLALSRQLPTEIEETQEKKLSQQRKFLGREVIGTMNITTKISNSSLTPTLIVNHIRLDGFPRVSIQFLFLPPTLRIRLRAWRLEFKGSIIDGGCEVFSLSPCPERLWGLLSLLSDVSLWIFPGGKAAGAWSWPLTSIQCYTSIPRIRLHGMVLS